MKTILEWFNTIENKELREKAIANTHGKDLCKLKHNLSNALFSAFIWERSNEGFNYWNDVHVKVSYLIDYQTDREQLNAEYLQAQDETHRDVIAEAVVEVDRKIKELKNQLQ